MDALCGGTASSPFAGSFASSTDSSKSVPFEDTTGEGSAMSLGLDRPGDFCECGCRCPVESLNSREHLQEASRSDTNVEARLLNGAAGELGESV